MGTWQALIGSASFSLINGGLAGSIWSYIATWICTISVTLSLAEMASMAPTSGGQYHCERTCKHVCFKIVLTFCLIQGRASSLLQDFRSLSATLSDGSLHWDGKHQLHLHLSLLETLYSNSPLPCTLSTHPHSGTARS